MTAVMSTKEKIVERRKSREADSLKVWSALVRKVAGGKELGQKDLDQLDDAALMLDIENPAEVFTDDIEELKRFEMLERESTDSHTRCEVLQQTAKQVADEIQRLQHIEIPRLQREAADALATLRTLAVSAGEAERIKRQNPRLFG